MTALLDVGRSPPNKRAQPREPKLLELFVLGCAGLVSALVTMIAGARVTVPTGAIPFTSWLGLLPTTSDRMHVAAGAVAAGGLAGLFGCWLIAWRVLARHSETAAWCLGAVWAAPFVIGPPTMSNDVFAYVAQGTMLRRGIDPYSHGPATLGAGHVLAAVDPAWRGAPSPYGPLASTLEHLAVSIGGTSPLAAVLLFRGLGIACVAGIGILAAQLAGPHRSTALALTVLNPLLAINIISAGHLDGITCLLLLAAIKTAKAGRWSIALVCAAAAGSIKATAFAAVLVILVAHLRSDPARRRWRVAVQDAAIAAGAMATLSLLMPDGWGWIRALTRPTHGSTPLAPASLVGDLLGLIVPGAPLDDRLTSARVTLLLAAGCIIAALVLAARRSTLEHGIGGSMLAAAALSPVVYSWYMLPAAVCLASTGERTRRREIALISGAGCLLNLTRVTAAQALSLTLIILVVVASDRVRGTRTGRAAPGHR